MKKFTKDWLLRFLTVDVASVGFVSPAIFIVLGVLTDNMSLSATLWVILIMVAIVAVAVQGAFSFRFYNIEQAIDKSLNAGIPIADALIADWPWRGDIAMYFACAMGCALVLTQKLGEAGRVIFLTVSCILALLFVTGLVTKTVVAVIGMRYHAKHRPYREGQTMLRFGGDAQHEPDMIPITEVIDYYHW